MTKIPMIKTKLADLSFCFEHLIIVILNLFEIWFLDLVISFHQCSSHSICFSKFMRNSCIYYIENINYLLTFIRVLNGI
jgi:hypothetical protein